MLVIFAVILIVVWGSAVEIFEATDEIVGGDAVNSVVDWIKLTLELINSLTPITLETEFVKLFW